MHFYNSGWAMGWGMLWMVLWWLVPILGIVALALWIGGTRRRREKTALDILKERYARGEIEQEEFMRKKRELGE
jgi:putative membrane protein